MPQVSVMMPAYNAEAFLAESVESILNQTFTDFELLILNDGSTDGTLALAQTFAEKDPRVRVLDNGENRGLAYTRNRLLREAQGEFLAILDSDDISLSERLAKQVAYLQAHPEVGVLGGWVIPYSKGEQSTEEKGVWQLLGNPARVATRLLFQNVIAQSTVMLRREVAVLGYDDSFPPAEDYHLWVRASFQTQVDNLQEVLTYYRLHEGNISKRKRDTIIANSLRIKLLQLKRLGLKPTPQEQRIHTYLTTLNLMPTPSLCREILVWLNKIYAANTQKEFYHMGALKGEIQHRLEVILPEFLPLGNEVAEILAKNELLKMIFPKQKIRQFTLLARCKAEDAAWYYKIPYKVYKKIK